MNHPCDCQRCRELKRIAEERASSPVPTEEHLKFALQTLLDNLPPTDRAHFEHNHNVTIVLKGETYVLRRLPKAKPEVVRAVDGLSRYIAQIDRKAIEARLSDLIMRERNAVKPPPIEWSTAGMQSAPPPPPNPDDLTVEAIGKIIKWEFWRDK